MKRCSRYLKNSAESRTMLRTVNEDAKGVVHFTMQSLFAHIRANALAFVLTQLLYLLIMSTRSLTGSRTHKRLMRHADDATTRPYAFNTANQIARVHKSNRQSRNDHTTQNTGKTQNTRRSTSTSCPVTSITDRPVPHSCHSSSVCRRRRCGSA